MREGFTGRPSASLAGALLVLGLLAVPPLSRPASGPAWWEVRLTIKVKGEYAISVMGRGTPASGEYTCLALWEGRLEPDGDDFLLVHLKSEILDWGLKEKSGPAGGATLLEAPGTPRPALRLNYVLRDGRDVKFDFDLEGIPVPFHASPFKVPLELPRSAGRSADIPGQGYDDFIRLGSNRIVLPAAELGRQTAERTFSWEWRRGKWMIKDSRAVLVAQSHSVEAVIALVAH